MSWFSILSDIISPSIKDRNVGKEKDIKIENSTISVINGILDKKTLPIDLYGCSKENLIELLKNFDLCFDIDSDNKLLFPTLLPDEQSIPSFVLNIFKEEKIKTENIIMGRRINLAQPYKYILIRVAKWL